MATIAVVDDIAVNRELLVTLLEPLGHSILEAENGVVALALAQSARPDLIICDILMPEVDGYEFVRRLRAIPELRDLPVLFCSAHFLEPEAQNLARACGVRAVLTKPIEPDVLYRAVETVLANGSLEPVSGALSANGFEQRHLQLIRSKLSEKVAELQQANDKLGALIELSLQLASERDKKRLIEHVCQNASQLLGADLGTVAVCETGDSGSAAHVSHCGIDASTIDAMDRISLEDGALGRVYREAQVLHLDAVTEDADLGLPSGYPRVAGLVAAPVRSLAATYGWICLGRHQGSAAFTDTDAELLRIIAAQAGRIYENGSLYAKLGEHTRALEAEIVERERSQRHLAVQCAVARVLNEAADVGAAVERLLEAVCIGLGFAAATLWRVEDHGNRLHCVGVWSHPDQCCAAFERDSRRLRIERDDGLPGAAWSTGVPVWAMDLDAYPGFLRVAAVSDAGLRSGGAMPISVRGEVVAVIDVFSQERCDMDARLAETLSTLGIQIGQFLERTEQHRRIVRLTRVYAVLSGINAAIVRIHDRPQLFAEACRIAVRQGNFGMAWIGEVDSGSAEVVPVAWAGLDDDIGVDRLSIGDIETGQGVVREAVRTGRACIVDHLADGEPVGRRREEALRRGYQSMIALPLTIDASVHGVMVLYAEEPEFFTTEEQALLTELANDISFALEFIAKQDLLAYMALHDVLTGLVNRADLLDRLDAALHMGRRDGDAVGVVVWDIKRFRNINDTFGRQVGDSLLKELAGRFRTVWPYEKGIARIGVDQFACALSGEWELPEIAHMIERTTRAIAGEPIEICGHELHVGLSAGVAIAGAAEDDADSLLKNAEAALRQAKKSGVGYLFYEPGMNALIAKTLLLENRLRQALDRNEFVLHYQPKISGATGAVTGLEALIRWKDPSNGIVPPGTFIPILEDTGMIIEVGAWAIRKALENSRWLRDAGVDVARIAVNVSALQLQHKDFVRSMQEVARGWDSELPLDLEITESMLMTDFKNNVARLDAVRDMGIQIAIDDFGTGYSSLGYLARLPVNALKIDRSFIETMAMTPESMTIVSTIISLAHSLNLKVIGEGVEDEEQAKFLRLLKCNELQGFLISRPLPLEDVVDFVRGRTC